MERIVKILDLLASNKTIKLSLLAELLDVSMVTLRRDLDSLEKRGIICRTHGYVSLDGADDTGKRMAINHLIKRKIANAAAQTVEEGKTVMLESGSCCALLAEELAIARKNVTIITNSVFIANFVCRMPIKVILLGGHLQPESHVLAGPITVNCAQMFFSDKFFLGTNGFIPEYGFTGGDQLHAETSLEMAKRAKKVYILTESAKFHSRGVCNMIPFDKIAGIFTDDRIPREAEVILQKNNILLHKVPAAEEKIAWRQFPGQLPFLFTEKDG